MCLAEETMTGRIAKLDNYGPAFSLTVTKELCNHVVGGAMPTPVDLPRVSPALGWYIAIFIYMEWRKRKRSHQIPTKIQCVDVLSNCRYSFPGAAHTVCI